MFDTQGGLAGGIAEYEKQRREKALAANLAQSTAYVGESSPDSSLRLLADQVSEATVRIEHLVDNLGGLALALHGPRPEPVHDQIGKAAADSLTARITNLLVAVERAERAYGNVMR